MTLHAVGEGAEFGLHAVEQLQRFPCIAAQHLARRRHRNAATAAFEQAHAGLLLHLADALAHRRRHDRLARARRGDIALLADGDEQPQ